MKKITIAILALIPAIALAAGGKKQMTALDLAFEAAAKNPTKQSEYYNLFLNSEIFIPTRDVPLEERRKRADEGETIRPIIVESEGKSYFMLFDTKERLGAWAKREVGFTAVPGHVVVEMMGPDIHWALNVGTDHVKIFVPDEIKWLKETVARTREEKLSNGTTVLVGAPAKIPAGLVESLTKNLVRNSEVAEAYLGQVHYVKEGEVPHLALVLRTDAVSPSTIEAIRKDLATASRGFVGKDGYIDIFVDDGKGVAYQVTKSVKPFYVRKTTR
jgi:hypothetical protein